MAKSYVLKALRLLGLEEMLKISQAFYVKQNPLKKAAGEELIAFDEPPKKKAKRPPQEEAKILPFPRSVAETEETVAPQPPKAQEQAPSKAEGEPVWFLTSETVLWQRELAKDAEPISRKEAVTGYKKSTEMYVVKTTSEDGKEKIRFASTRGVLVDKKQA